MRVGLTLSEEDITAMRILATFFILCSIFCTACDSKSTNYEPSMAASAQNGYDLGIAAYKRGHYQAALFNFEQRANQGDPVAQFCLGFMYNHSQVPVPKKLLKNTAEEYKVNAEAWYTKAAEQGYPMALNNLGVMYVHLYEESKGKNSKALESARKWFQKAASKGYPPAQYNLCIMSEQEDTAFEWNLKAAKQGYPPAQDHLGSLYYHGEEVDKDLEAAVKWFRAAAEQNYASAQTNLGMCYSNGKGVRKNQEEAFNWYKKAAEQNYARGQLELGRSYHLGEGVKVNLQQALNWYLKAAEQGNLEAQNNLAVIYRDDIKNSEMGLRWFFRAAQQGYSLAQRNIGKKFEDGQDELPLDPREAYYWYSLALKDKATLERSSIKNIVSKVKETRERIETSLEGKEISQIQERVNSWQPKQFQGAGTGFYVDKNHILTNAHVVISNWNEAREGSVPVFGDEFRIPYRRVILKAVDHVNDLALLYDERGNTDENGNAVTAKFRRESIEFGEKVSVFGYPQSNRLSYEGNLTSGIVSGLSYSINHPTPKNGFQHTAPTQRGNSGGPIFDSAGNVVGVSVRGLLDYEHLFIRSTGMGVDIPQIINLAQNINFAIHFDVITEFLTANGVWLYSMTEIMEMIEMLEEKEKGIASSSTVAPLKEIPLQTIKAEAKKFTVPVLTFKNKAAPPFSVEEITIDELKSER